MVYYFLFMALFGIGLGTILRYVLANQPLHEHYTFLDLFRIPSNDKETELEPFMLQLMGVMWLILAATFKIGDYWLSWSQVWRLVMGLTIFSPPIIGTLILKRLRKVYSKQN